MPTREAAARPPAASDESIGSDRNIWILAANLGIVALALGQVLRGPQRVTVVVAALALAVTLVGVLAVRSALRAARSGALTRLLAGGLIVSIVVVVVVLGRAAVGDRAVLLAAAAFAGLALVLRWVVEAVETSEADEAPWQQLAAGPQQPSAPGVRYAVGAACGALLLLAAAVGAAHAAFVARDAGPAAGGFVGGAVVVAALMALVVGPLAFVARMRARRVWAERERGRQRQEVAAHLHDSVLQTLALIQRGAIATSRSPSVWRSVRAPLRATPPRSCASSSSRAGMNSVAGPRAVASSTSAARRRRRGRRPSLARARRRSPRRVRRLVPRA